MATQVSVPPTSVTPRPDGRPRIAVLGAGFGGLEAAFYLRWKLGARAGITLVTDHSRFLFKPNTIYIPFGLDPDSLTFDLHRPAQRRDIDLKLATVEGVDPDAGVVATTQGPVSYDHLVIATGAAMRADEVPGLAENANTIFTPEEMLRLRHSLEKLLEDVRAGQRRRILFLAPPNNKCVGPLYEMVMMTDTWLRRKGVRSLVDMSWATFEKHYIQVFGPRLHDAVIQEFEHRGIEGHTEYVVKDIEPGTVTFAGGEKMAFDLLVSFPPYIASTRYPELPGDDRGFIATEYETRQVKGHPEIFAIGDAGDFPVKQAFLALLQGDTVGSVLSAQILHQPDGAVFDATSMCVMEQFDHATFAQVPLRLSGRSDVPVEVRPGDEKEYLVGVSPMWRLGKKMIGASIPWRFGNGHPFHAGVFWKSMDTGLKVMSSVLAK